jgi:hypothetical protein
MFYNQFLPGGTGGDIMKSYLLLKETPGKATGALLAVVFDRMVGLVALISITGALIALRYSWLTQLQETKHLVWLLVAILSGAVLMLVTSFVVSGFHLAHKLPERFPGREKLIELSAAYHLYARHWRATLAALGASIVAHLATFGTFLCVAMLFVPMSQRSIFSPLCRLNAQSRHCRSVSPALVCARKSFKSCSMGSAGVPEAVAVLIGSMSFLVMLASSAPGGIVYFLYKPSGQARHVKLREMREEVATLEHEITESE